jgi:hypothetical protein
MMGVRRRPPAAGRFAAPDRPSGAHPVHLWHLDVHENDVPGLGVAGFDGPLAILHERGFNTDLLQQGSQDELVDGVIFRDQDIQPRNGRRVARRISFATRSPGVVFMGKGFGLIFVPTSLR